MEKCCSECDRFIVVNDFYVSCHGCKLFFHGSCASIAEFEYGDLEKFHCFKCTTLCGPSIVKAATNDHRQNKYEKNADNKSIQSGSPRFLRDLLNRRFENNHFAIKLVHGEQLSVSYLSKKGFNNPILVKEKQGLNMKVPGELFNEDFILSRLGNDYPIDVVDARKQSAVKLSLKRFVELLKQAEAERVYTLNLLSLELSRTPLAKLIEAPEVVNKLCWVSNHWPESAMKPTVSKYCLLSMAKSYTDFHIDFGGTSVWYHVLRGEKIFYLIEPNDENLLKYEQWIKDANSSEFFGDFVANCYSLRLEAGNTVLLPSGWIHAVYTPCDSIVFGGNFLHSMNISLQLKSYEIEKRIKTNDGYKFPYYEMTNWYAAPSVLKQIANAKMPSQVLVDGVHALVHVLKQWLRKREEFTVDKQKSYPVVPEEFLLEAKASELISKLHREWRRAENFLRCKPFTKKQKTEECSQPSTSRTDNPVYLDKDDTDVNKWSEGEASDDRVPIAVTPVIGNYLLQTALISDAQPRKLQFFVVDGDCPVSKDLLEILNLKRVVTCAKYHLSVFHRINNSFVTIPHHFCCYRKYGDMCGVYCTNINNFFGLLVALRTEPETSWNDTRQFLRNNLQSFGVNIEKDIALVLVGFFHFDLNSNIGRELQSYLATHFRLKLITKKVQTDKIYSTVFFRSHL